MKDLYYWSFNEHADLWTDSEETIENCIEQARLDAEDEDFNTVFIGTIDTHIPTIDAETIIDNLVEQAYEECGECSSGWLDNLPKKNIESLEKKLNATLYKWLEEVKEVVTFGLIEDVKAYDLKTGKQIKED